MKYDLIIWDFNGTILDDVDVCYQILKKLLISRNLKVVSKAEYLEKFTFPVINYYREVGFDVNEYKSISKDFTNLYQEVWPTCKPYPDTEIVLQAIRDLKIKQIILSASEINGLKKQLEHLNITSYFDDILGLTDNYANSKKDIGLKWIAENGFQNKRILYIGDSLHDLEIAKTLNATPVLVSFGHTSKQRLQNHGYLVIDKTNEILKLL